MTQKEIAKLKRELTSGHLQRRPFPRPGILPGRGVGAAGNKLLTSFFQKAGLDMGRLEKVVAQAQAANRQAAAKRQAQLKKRVAADKKALAHGLESRRKALEILGSTPTKDHRVRFVTLDTPFMFLELPSFDNTLVDSSIAPGNSVVRFHLKANNGGDYLDPSTVEFYFYFLWTNDSAEHAVVDVDTTVILNGHCEVRGASGLIIGDWPFLDIYTELGLLELWNLSPGSPASPLEQFSQYQQVCGIAVHAGSFYTGGTQEKDLYLEVLPSDLSYKRFLVPPGASAVFQVGVYVGYGFQAGGEDIDDLIEADFADRVANRFVQCPGVNLLVITPFV